MKEWFIYQPDGNNIGPVDTGTVAQGVVAGKIPRDAHVASPGDSTWLLVLSVPDIAAEVSRLEATNEAVPARPIASVPPAPPPRALDSAKPLNLTRPPLPKRPVINDGDPTMELKLGDGAELVEPKPVSVRPPPPPPSSGRPPPPAPPHVPPQPAPALASPETPPLAPPMGLASPMGLAPPAALAAEPPKAVEPAKPEAKKDEKPPYKPDPKLAIIPFAIFAVCFVISVLVGIVGLVMRPSSPTPPGATGGESHP